MHRQTPWSIGIESAGTLCARKRAKPLEDREQSERTRKNITGTAGGLHICALAEGLLVTLRLEAHSDPALTFAAMLALFERRYASDPAGYDTTLAPGQHASDLVTIADASCTTWVAQEWDMHRDGTGNLHLQYTR